MTDALEILKYANTDLSAERTFDEVQAGVPLALEDQFVPIYGSSFPSLQHATILGTELKNAARFLRSLQTVYPQRNYTGFESRAANVIQFAMASKLQFQTPFGLDAVQGGLMLQPIRPYLVYASGGTIVNDWLQASASSGWSAAFWTINLNHTVSPVTQDQFSALILGVADYAQSPKMQEIQVNDPSKKQYGVESFPSLGSLDDTQLHLIKENYYLGRSEQSWKIDVNFGEGGVSVPVVVGVQAARQVGATAETS
jgi:hypothetical protein